ncbi:MAG: FtsX-like permease family protein [Bacteroidales bacterium]|jgi:putative ABC transport system permease protein|nr:FtsX-like permease family protein [Bacteroidales bacterium]MDD2263553.1 FtsX-like permease family protein [Bacteroidales bacterium]MDD2830656.1 FtsX-like permease family protein [Bacteroidales bacterium]MDD3207855.1 FtsX-like permease family protein [Bacteroidales bacterium]MDD3696637.1 FtsX-like permease family protein [Bacteroidales bacterium]
MLTFKLSFKNLMGNGKRTWLNVSVLSIAFVAIVFFNGLLDGWNKQAKTDTIAWETGYGRLSHPLYDPYDPYTFSDAHGIPGFQKEILVGGQAVPVLVTQASAYPNGRLINIVLKGIDPAQSLLELPSRWLDSLPEEIRGTTIPAIIGQRMARSAGLKTGDRMVIRWRDVNGIFDAREVTVTGIFKTNVPTVDVKQFWIPLETLREITGMYGEITYFALGEELAGSSPWTGNEAWYGGWFYTPLDTLMKDIETLMEAKKGGTMIISFLLLCIALLAIFDTQVLSIFRRQKEIGTYMALGMTRVKVITVFTIEGAIHALLAILLGTLWGVPVLAWIHYAGIPLPEMSDQAGLAIGEKIIPVYSMTMILATVLLVVITSFIVSYIPARKIAKMQPTRALKGKLL